MEGWAERFKRQVERLGRLKVRVGETGLEWGISRDCGARSIGESLAILLSVGPGREFNVAPGTLWEFPPPPFLASSYCFRVDRFGS